MIFSALLLGVVVYFLTSAGWLNNVSSWQQGVQVGFTLLAVTLVMGGIFGYWYSYKLKRRLEVLYESMIFIEKGNLQREVPYLGEDEIGRMGKQLGQLAGKWEEQVGSLQRLSTTNAELAEKARLSAVVEERQRLARELHDAVSQQLFAISMTATAVGRTMDIDFEKARRQISLIEEMSSVAQSEMRALLLHLRPVHLEGKPLSQGIRELLEELRAKVPIEIGQDIDDSIRLPKGIEDHLFRIVQEALSNALRHSKAANIEVRLVKPNDSIRLSIRDDGVGFDLDEKKQTSYGLVSMRERVNEIGGSIQIITAPGKGARIEIRVPIMMTGGSKE